MTFHEIIGFALRLFQPFASGYGFYLLSQPVSVSDDWACADARHHQPRGWSAIRRVHLALVHMFLGERKPNDKRTPTACRTQIKLMVVVVLVVASYVGAHYCSVPVPQLPQPVLVTPELSSS